MNQAEKEEYLREYAILKNEGKPFFPYAVAKDSVMAVIVMIVIMVLSLLFGAELGPKVNPTSTTYVPRPDWYFFFLFEVLRVMRNVPKFTPMATIGVPTLCMIGLFLLPLYDRSPERLITRRPIALAAGLATIACIAYLTYAGAGTGSPNNAPNLPPPAGLTAAQRATFLAGEVVVGESGCEGCHLIGGNGNNGPGPPLTHIGSIAAAGRDRVHAQEPDRADAVVRGPGEDVAEEVRGSGLVPVAASVARRLPAGGLAPPLSFAARPVLSGQWPIPPHLQSTPQHHRSPRRARSPNRRCRRCSTASRASMTA